MIGFETVQDHTINNAFLALESSLPAIFSRSSVPNLLGGAVSAGTLANMGKEGPPCFLLNGHIVYEKSSFLAWLRTKAKPLR